MNSTRIRKTAIGRHLLYSLWRDRRIGAAIATAAAVLLGVAIAHVMPRSPATATQALIVMVTSFAVGGVAGLVMQSRWAMLLATIAYAIAIEIGRLHIVGPTVDAIRLNEPCGILALILGLRCEYVSYLH